MAVEDTQDRQLDAERAVIGSLLIDEGILREVLAAVDEKDFLHPTNRLIFRTARALFRSGEPADAITIRGRIGEQYSSYLLQLMEITPTSANWREYAELMHEQAVVQRARDLADKLALAVTLDDCRPISAQLAQLLSDGRGLDAWTMPELLESFFQSQDPSQPSVEYITFGLEAVDRGSYIQRGDVVVVGGCASDGKTCLALQMAWHMAEKYHVGFFSLETDRSKLRDRLMSHAAQLRFSDIKQKTIDEERWTALAGQTAEFARRGLTVIESSGMTVTDIQAASQAYGFQAIFIDYVQLIIPETDPRTSRPEQMASVSRALHTFAQKSKTLVVELAQLHRMDQDKWRAPNMHDLKETGQLEQDADMIFLLYQPGPKSKLDKDTSRILTIGKHKEGRRGDWPLYFDGEKQTFSVMASEDGGSVLRSLQAAGRNAQTRNRAKKDDWQVEITELPEREDGLPF